MSSLKITPPIDIESLQEINKQNEAKEHKQNAAPYWKQIGYQAEKCKVPSCTEYATDTGHLLCIDHLAEMCEDMAYRWK